MRASARRLFGGLSALLIVVAALTVAASPAEAAYPKNPPTGFRLVEKTATSVTLTWNTTSGANKYGIRWSKGRDVTDSSYRSSTSNQVQITGLDRDTTYHFWIRSYHDTTGLSDYSSSPISIRTDAYSFAPPGHLQVDAALSRALDLSWDAVYNANAYRVQLSGSGVPTKTYVTSDTSTMDRISFTATGLQPGASYTIKVRGLEQAANGDDVPYDLTDWRTITAGTPGIDSGTNVTQRPPQQSETTAFSNHQVSLAWLPVVAADGYRIQWWSDDDSTRRYLSMPSSGTASHTFLDTLTSDADPPEAIRGRTGYHFRIAALDENDTAAGVRISGYGDTVDVRTSGYQEPAATNLSVDDSTLTYDNVDVSWDPVPGATSYNVYWTTDSTPSSSCEPGCTVLTGADLDLAHPSIDLIDVARDVDAISPGRPYYVLVSARDANGTLSDYQVKPLKISVPEFATSTPTNLRQDFGLRSETSVALTWDGVTFPYDGSEYDLQYSKNKELIGSTTHDIYTSATSKTLSGLEKDTLYYVRVRVVSNSSTHPARSEWGPILEAKTQVAQGALKGALAGGTADSRAATVAVAYDHAGNQVGSDFVGANGSYLIRDMSPGSYRVQLLQVGGINVTSPWVGSGGSGEVYRSQAPYYTVSGWTNSVADAAQVPTTTPPPAKTVSGRVTGVRCRAGTRVTALSDRSVSVSKDEVMSDTVTSSNGTFTLVGLPKGEPYWIRFVAASDSCGVRSVHVDASTGNDTGVETIFDSIPSTVERLRVQDVANDDATIAWDAVPTADHYRIYWSRSPSMPSACAPTCTVVESNDDVAPSVSLADVIGSLRAGETYYVKVSAISNGDTITGWQSTPLRVNLLGDAEAIPGVVQNIAASDVTDTEMTVSWDRVPTATEYRIYYSTSSNQPGACEPNCKVITPTDLDRPQYHLSGLTRGARYWIKVSAINADGKTITGWQTLGYPVDLTGESEVIPDTVGGIEHSAVTATAATVSWDRVPTATKYRIYYSTSSNMPSACEPNCKVITPADLDNPQYRLTGLASGAVYYVKISAITTYGGRDHTITGWQPQGHPVDLDGVPQTIPDAVQNIEPDEVTWDGATLTWDAVPTAATYRIYYSTSSSMPGSCEPNCEVVTPNAVGDTRTYPMQSLDNFRAGTNYYVKISAINASGKTITSWQPSPVPVRLAVVTGFETSGSVVSWDAIPPATKYRVYASTSADLPGACEPNCQVITPSNLGQPSFDLADLVDPDGINRFVPGATYYVKVSAINASGKTVTGWQDEPLTVVTGG